MTERSYLDPPRALPADPPALAVAVLAPDAAPRQRPAAEGGSNEAFGKLVRAHSRYVWRVLRCLGVRPADLDDLCQETFVIVHRKLPTYEPRAAPTSWIYAIALRVASDYRKRAHRRHEALVGQLPELRSPDDQERELQSREHWQLLESVTRGLSEEQRQVFVLFEIEALTLQEVSEIVGAPLQTVYSRLRAARKHVAERVTRMRKRGSLP